MIFNWHELNRPTIEPRQQHVKRSIKPLPSLLANVNLSTKTIEIFCNNARSILSLYIIFAGDAAICM